MSMNLDSEHLIELTEGDHRTLQLKTSIDHVLRQSQLIVDTIDEDAGFRIFLDIDKHVANCLGDLDITYGNTDDVIWETTEYIAQRVETGINLAIEGIFNLVDEKLHRAHRLLADLADKLGEVLSRLSHLLDWELEGEILVEVEVEVEVEDSWDTFAQGLPQLTH